MLEALFRWLCLTLVRIYFPTRAVIDKSQIPSGGKRIFVANHPNGLLDPLVLRILTDVPSQFLAKSTLFGNPFGRFAMRTFGAIPVYRRQDGGEGKAMQDGNEKTFTLCREGILAGHPLALFPEGVSHADPSLHELKTGAARIALSTDALLKDGDDVKIIPVGLSYTDRSVFRSGVVGTVGTFVSTRDFRAQYAVDQRGAVDALTEAITRSLSAVVVQASTRTVLDGVARVAEWTGRAEQSEDLEARHAYAKRLLDAYARWETRDPRQLESVVREVREYDRILRSLGVSDPWDLEVGHVRLWPALKVCFTLLFMAPLALVGTLASWLPYRAVNPVAKRMTSHEDVLGTMKLLGGLFFVGFAWIAEAIALSWFGHWYWGLLWIPMVAACSYVALLFSEQLTTAIRALQHSWLRNTRPTVHRRLVARRQALANAVTTAIEEAESSLVPQAPADESSK